MRMLTLLLVLYLRPPVCDVSPNYEVVVFQPRTLSPPHLGSCRLTLHFNLSLPPHIFLLSFLGHSFPPSSPPNLGIVRSLVSFLGGFSQKSERPGRLHSLAVAQLVPCSPHYLDMPAPFRLPWYPPPLPPSPPLPCFCDPITVGGISVGRSARSWCKGRL